MTQVIFCFQATDHGFSPRAVMIGFVGTFTIRKYKLLISVGTLVDIDITLSVVL